MSRTNEQTEELKVMDQAFSDWMKVAEWASGETASPGIRAIVEMGFEAGWTGRDEEIAQLRGDLAGEEALRLEASMSLATALDQIDALERAVVEASQELRNRRLAIDDYNPDRDSLAGLHQATSEAFDRWNDVVDDLIAARIAARIAAGSETR